MQHFVSRLGEVILPCDFPPGEMDAEPHLAIAREFIRRLGGDLWRTRESRKGPAWLLRLPTLGA